MSHAEIACKSYISAGEQEMTSQQKDIHVCWL